METLKIPVNKKGRILQNLTKVQRFYSEFDSDISNSQSSSPSEDGNGRVFTFETKGSRYRSITKPSEPPRDKMQGVSKTTTPNGDNHLDGEPNHGEVVNYATLVIPVSPGLSRNQDLKDKALDLIYQRKIKELKCKQNIFYVSANGYLSIAICSGKKRGLYLL